MEIHSHLNLPALKLLDKFAGGGHKPGSGSAAALTGLLACSLTETVIKLFLGKNDYALRHIELSKVKSAIETDIRPALQRAFDDDSEAFHKVYSARRRRDQASTKEQKDAATHEALGELRQATEIVIGIAKNGHLLADHALFVFDEGFKAARGDSAVAVGSAISCAKGAIDVAFLNLASFQGERLAQDNMELLQKLRYQNKELAVAHEKRTELLHNRATEKNARFRIEASQVFLASRRAQVISDADIEKAARNLQVALWRNRDRIFEVGRNLTPIDVLDPSVAFEVAGYKFEYATDLGRTPDGSSVAGVIDKENKKAAVSKRFPGAVQRFTGAHELGLLNEMVAD